MVRSGKNLAPKVKLAQSAWILNSCTFLLRHVERTIAPNRSDENLSTEIIVKDRRESTGNPQLSCLYRHLQIHVIVITLCHPIQNKCNTIRFADVPRLALFLLFPVPSEQKTWPPVFIFTVLLPWSISPLNNRDSDIIGPYQGAEINSDWTKSFVS